jgi:hypothetical protein
VVLTRRQLQRRDAPFAIGDGVHFRRQSAA